MSQNDSDINFGETLMSVISLLESSVTGSILNSKSIDPVLYKCNRDIIRALVQYLNNSIPSNDEGTNALNSLIKYVTHKQNIFNRKYALDITDEYDAVKE